MAFELHRRLTAKTTPSQMRQMIPWETPAETALPKPMRRGRPKGAFGAGRVQVVRFSIDEGMEKLSELAAKKKLRCTLGLGRQGLPKKTTLSRPEPRELNHPCGDPLPPPHTSSERVPMPVQAPRPINPIAQQVEHLPQRPLRRGQHVLIQQGNACMRPLATHVQALPDAEKHEHPHTLPKPSACGQPRQTRAASTGCGSRGT